MGLGVTVAYRGEGGGVGGLSVIPESELGHGLDMTRILPPWSESSSFATVS